MVSVGYLVALWSVWGTWYFRLMLVLCLFSAVNSTWSLRARALLLGKLLDEVLNANILHILLELLVHLGRRTSKAAQTRIWFSHRSEESGLI